MENEVTVDPRYLSYNKADVETLLGKVDNADAEPTEGSTNMISSGAVAAALTDMAEVGEKVGDVPDENPEPEEQEEEPGE